jgi:hypothetical protein
MIGTGLQNKGPVVYLFPAHKIDCQMDLIGAEFFQVLQDVLEVIYLKFMVEDHQGG